MNKRQLLIKHQRHHMMTFLQNVRAISAQTLSLSSINSKINAHFERENVAERLQLHLHMHRDMSSRNHPEPELPRTNSDR